MANRLDPFEQARRFYEETEQRTAEAMEQLVRRDSFGEIVARMTENVMAVTRIGFDVSDLVVRNLRIAGRQDVIRLGRQLARTEDKLELVLQAVERLEGELAAGNGDAPRGAGSAAGSSEDGGSAARGGSGAAGAAEGTRSGGARGGRGSGPSEGSEGAGDGERSGGESSGGEGASS